MEQEVLASPSDAAGGDAGRHNETKKKQKKRKKSKGQHQKAEQFAAYKQFGDDTPLEKQSAIIEANQKIEFPGWKLEQTITYQNRLSQKNCFCD